MGTVAGSAGAGCPAGAAIAARIAGTVGAWLGTGPGGIDGGLGIAAATLPERAMSEAAAAADGGGAGVPAAGIGLFAYMYITTEIPQPEKFALAEKTTVYYNDGTTPIGSYAEQNREIISCADLPDYVGLVWQP